MNAPVPFQVAVGERTTTYCSLAKNFPAMSNHPPRTWTAGSDMI